MSNFSHPNPAKENSRLGNLQTAKENPHLFSKKQGKLRVDWLELCGKNAPTLQILEKEKVFFPSKFIGIDLNKNHILECQDLYPNHLFLKTRIEDIFQGKYAQETYNVGVVNYDTEEDWTTLVNIRSQALVQFLKRQKKRIGACLLIVNGVSRRQSVKQSKILAQEFCRELCFEMGEVPKILNDKNPYFIQHSDYRGKNKKGGNKNWTMVNIRIIV